MSDAIEILQGGWTPFEPPLKAYRFYVFEIVKKLNTALGSRLSLYFLQSLCFFAHHPKFYTNTLKTSLKRCSSFFSAKICVISCADCAKKNTPHHKTYYAHKRTKQPLKSKN